MPLAVRVKSAVTLFRCSPPIREAGELPTPRRSNANVFVNSVKRVSFRRW